MDSHTIFYIIGGALTALAILVSFIGIRDRDFPPSGGVVRLIIAVFAALVVVAGAYAILSAREEQAERREHLAEREERFEEAANEAIDQPLQVPGPERGDRPAREGEEVEGAPGGEAAAGDELVTHGAEVFAVNGCASCHTLTAADATGATGPNLDESLDGRDAAYIEEAIVEPDATVAEGFQRGLMPAFDDLPEQDLNALVAFLQFAAEMN